MSFKGLLITQIKSDAFRCFCDPSVQTGNTLQVTTAAYNIPAWNSLCPNTTGTVKFLLLSNTTKFIGLITQWAGHLWHLIHTFPAEADCWASKERISVFQHSQSTPWKLDAHDWTAYLHEIFLSRQLLRHKFSGKGSSKKNFAVLSRIRTGL